MVAEQKRMEHENGPNEHDKMEAQFVLHNRGAQVGYSDVKVGGRREGLDTADGAGTTPQGGRDIQFTRVDETSDRKTKKGGGVPTKKPRDLALLVLGCPRRIGN